MGGLLGLGIAVTVLVGFFRRSSSARQWSRGLSITGLVFLIPGLFIVVAFNPSALYVIAVLIFRCTMWGTLVVCHSTDSSADWFSE